VRGKDLTERFSEDELLYHFGPFPSGQLFREALKIVKRLFKFYDTQRPIGSEKSKVVRGQIDFNRQIGLYPTRDNKVEYQKTIRHIKLFFEGRKQELITELETDMMAAARHEAFEEAGIIKKKIFALQHIQDIALIRDDQRHYRDDKHIRIEAYDIAHLAGKNMVGVMTVVVGDEVRPSEYRKFKIKSVTGSNDPAALKEVLERRFSHSEWPSPNIVVVDGSTAQKNVAEHILRKFGLVIPVVAVVKDEHHKPIRLIAGTKLKEQFGDQILLANAESHRFALAYHRKKRDTILLK
jgi:excinuclease ABC subunit C